MSKPKLEKKVYPTLLVKSENGTVLFELSGADTMGGKKVHSIEIDDDNENMVLVYDNDGNRIGHIGLPTECLLVIESNPDDDSW